MLGGANKELGSMLLRVLAHPFAMGARGERRARKTRHEVDLNASTICLYMSICLYFPLD